MYQSVKAMPGLAAPVHQPCDLPVHQHCMQQVLLLDGLVRLVSQVLVQLNGVIELVPVIDLDLQGTHKARVRVKEQVMVSGARL